MSFNYFTPQPRQHPRTDGGRLDFITDYTLDDYAAITAVNLTGFFHITQRAIRRSDD